MGRRTALYHTHVEEGAKIVDFGGWDMPLHYGSQLEEHHAVRHGAGMFDVSHMCVIDLRGVRAREFLRHLLANDVEKLKKRGKALYSCLLNETGGVLDDLIVYYLEDDFYRLVVNAGTRDKDLAWIRARAEGHDIQVDERDDLAMLAIQGPNARAATAAILPPACRTEALALPVFCGGDCGDWFIARTGYTGEDGFEVMLPAGRAVEVWNTLRAAGVTPAGLGARDTLRLEAGMNLYGNDMDESIDPLQSGLAWTVAFEPATRDFIGRAALEKIAAQPGQRLVGLLLEDRGVLRNHQRVISPAGEGEITSGGFSPTLNRSIALARIPVAASPGGVAEQTLQVDVRGRLLAVRVVQPPFVRNGQAKISL